MLPQRVLDRDLGSAQQPEPSSAGPLSFGSVEWAALIIDARPIFNEARVCEPAPGQLGGGRSSALLCSGAQLPEPPAVMISVAHWRWHRQSRMATPIIDAVLISMDSEHVCACTSAGAVRCPISPEDVREQRMHRIGRELK